MFDCLVAGEANVDLLVDGVVKLELGKEKLATGMDLVLGGSSAITAFNLARLGASVSFTGVIGQDSFGKFVEEKLLSAPVDLSGLRRTARERTGVTIWHSKDGRRAGVTYAGTIAMLRARDITEQQLKAARHLHVGAYFLLKQLHPGAPALFAKARKLGLTTSVDCNYDPAEQWDSNLRAVLQNTDIFFPNQQEALKLTGLRKPEAAALELSKLARVVVVKLGAQGAVVANQGRSFLVPAVPVQVVDTTGAGDSFNAGFLSKFLRGAKLEACARAGAQAGARNVRKIGGIAAFE